MSADDERMIYMRAIEELDQAHQKDFQYLFHKMKGRQVDPPAESKEKLKALVAKAALEYQKEKALK